MAWDLVLIAAGLVFLFLGGEALVRGSVSLAARFGLSALLVSLVIVGFGTSAPELLVSVQAALAGSPDIALGNVLGSNTANILLIGGTAAVIAPLALAGAHVKRDAIMMVAASLAIVAILWTGTVSRLLALAMVSALIAYLVFAYVSEQRDEETSAAPPQANLGLAMSLLAAFGGIAALVFGASLMVDGATALARGVGISEAVIGLTVVAVGTSLPELAATISASRKGQTEVVVGNILGSNVFNLLAILGITALITPIPVAAQFASFDAPVMAGVAVVAAIALLTLRRIGRTAGGALLAAYAGYVAIQVV
ncbi:calcium/sodium antiporter [Aureimonas mangrovi]|uniref:calcium/sodium antiporter n=1 Tax=Aureimonas mangrovi TaxID=2758041 RepID=UPI00163D486D|nr:calcium/sodium antiporter [Aureimonas mangrovi]